MRSVGDEFAPRVVQLREAHPHSLERVGKPPQLPAAAVAHRLVEAPAGDPVCRALEPADAAREPPRPPVAEQQRNQKTGARSEQQPSLHLVHARELILKRVGQKQCDGLIRDVDRRFGIAKVSTLDGSVLGSLGHERANDNRIELHIRRRSGKAGVLERLRERRQRGEEPEHDDARVGARRGVVDEIGLLIRGRQGQRQARSRVLEL